MKRQILYVMVTLAVVSFFALGVLQAQNRHVLTGKVPFDFVVGNTILPAGEYSFDAKNSGILHILNNDWSKSAMVFAVADKPCHSPNQNLGKLIFNKYGDRYFLSKVENPNIGNELKLRKSRSEKEAAMQATNPKSVVVALRLR